MMLRLQHERMTAGLIPSLREYSRYWGLTLDKLRAHARPDVLIMHPGPVNRGVELSPEVADGPYSVILDQVAKGVAVRMGVLFLLAGQQGRRTAGMSLLIRNGRVVDPANGVDAVQDVLIARRARRARRAATWRRPEAHDGRRRHRQGRVPGLHRHPRAPARAGLRVQGDGRHAAPARPPPAASPPSAAWPTPHPVNDNRSITDYILRQGARSRASCACTRSAPSPAASSGKELAELAELAEAGCVALLRRRQVRDERRALPPGHGVHAALRRAGHQPRRGRSTCRAAPP